MRRRLRIHIELSIVKKMNAAKPRFDCGSYDLQCVLQSVHVTDFVAVKCRDRQLDDAQFFQHELNDDLGIKMEIVRVFFERNLSERRGGIEAITGMEFCERDVK